MADIPQTYYWDLPFNPAADRLNSIIQHKIDNSCPDAEAIDEYGHTYADAVAKTATPANSAAGNSDIATPTNSAAGNPDIATPTNSAAGNSEVIARPEPDPQLDSAASYSRPQYEPYARCASLFFYNSDNGYRHICHRLKYDGDIALGRRFSRMLGLRLASSPLYSDVDAVVPVPLHWKRQWKRGYNQANVIAAEVAAVLGASLCSKLLVRKRKTMTQTVLTIEEKRQNVAGAFAVNPAAVPADFSPCHILIVDDVLTTGSTTAECHAALRKIFPKARISIATLACIEG